MTRVQVVAHDEIWPHEFVAFSEVIAAAMGSNLVAIHHIGSTSVAGLHAKPIVDMLVVVQDLAVTDQQNEQMGSLGYEAMGEFGIPGRRYFRKNDSNGQRTEQIHTFQLGSSDILRHLAFRDYLRVHPEAATAYSELKQQLAAIHPNDINAYMDGKDGFIKDLEAKALKWIEGMEVRSTARLVLFDPAGRILLFRHTDGHGREFWATPGGGVDPGETLRMAARREAKEELGLDVDQLRLLWSGHTSFLFADRRVSQSESFFLVDNHAEVLREDLSEVHQRERILEIRWWHLQEIENSHDVIFPRDLKAQLVRVM